MAEKQLKIFKRSDIKKNNENKRVQVIIHNLVYDLTEFLNEHPGGEEVLLEQAGRDATEAFEDVGHSKDARASMSKYLIGEIEESEKTKTNEKILKDWADRKDDSGSWKSWMIPVTLAVLATIIYRFYFHYH